MLEILIAVTSLVLIILMFRKQSRILSAKRTVQLGMDEATRAREEEDEPALRTRLTDIDYAEMKKAHREAEAVFESGDLAAAEKLFIKVLSFNPNHAEALNKLAVIYIQKGDLSRAERLFEQLFGMNKREAAYFANYGRCLYNQGRHVEAIAAYEEATKIDPKKASRFVSIGQIYYEQKDFPNALVYFSRALDLEPYNMEYHAIIGDIAELMGDRDRVYRTLKKMLDIDPYNEEIQRRFKAFNAEQKPAPAPNQKSIPFEEPTPRPKSAGKKPGTKKSTEKPK